MLLALVSGCGTSASGSAAGTTAKQTPSVKRGAGGDIPDTATYLRYQAGTFSIEYVEGWVQRGLTNGGVRVSDIDSSEQVTVGARPSQPLLAYVRTKGVAQTAKEYLRFAQKSLQPVSLPAGSAVRLSFRARSAPDPVTGKQVTLAVDRYYVSGRTHLAVITLATPVGVDNVDAFRRIAKSFTWVKS